MKTSALANPQGHFQPRTNSRRRVLSIGATAVAAFAVAMWLTYATAAPPDKPAGGSADKLAATSDTPSVPPSGAAPKHSAASSKTGHSSYNAFGLSQVQLINDQIQKNWDARKLVPSVRATDGEWCRRVFLDVLGKIPTVDELREFLNDRSPEKKVHLIDRLLGADSIKLHGPTYNTDYADYWADVWTNLLIGRAGNKRMDARSPTNREGMKQYLFLAFSNNRPYDMMVHDLLSAHGVSKADVDTGMAAASNKDNFNGAVNFLIGKMDDNGVQATAKTAQIFLGLSVQCTQCHNHPFNDWKQNQFWELNAFFRQTKTAMKRGPKKRVEQAELEDVDFRGEGGNPKSADLYYEERNGKLHVAYPVFVDGTEIPRSGWLREVNRRAELAKLVVKSPYLSKAIVNRMWAHFLGYGFTKPIDDMGPHNPPSNPDLLEALATEFAKGNGSTVDSGAYDMKQLIRWIVLSEPYAISCRVTAGNKRDDPSLGEKPLFSHFYLRQMRAEELYNSLLVADNVQRGNENQELRNAKERWLEQFVIAFGTDDDGEATTFNGSIPQTLMMFNGDLIKRATGPDLGTMLDRVAKTPGWRAADQIDYLYMVALARHPNSKEIGLANQILQGHKNDAKAALQDIWWAVLNSNEFILNH